MTSIQENAGLVIGSIITALGVVLVWIFQSGVFSILVGVGMGAVITYYVQTKTQKNAWKREYSVKIAETVYGSLYSEVKTIISSLEKGTFYTISFGKWQEFQNDHRHLMVTEDFRERLNTFSKDVDDYNDDASTLRQEIFPRIVNEASKKIFGLIAGRIIITVKYKTAYGSSSETLTPLDCLIKRNHPRELVMETYPRSEILTIQVQFENIQETVGLRPTTADEAKFNEFWKLCIEKEEDNETYRAVLLRQIQLLKESNSIFEELTKRIEEPWRI